MALRLLLGGARSGKSALAVRLATTWDGPVVFVVTAEALDAEMADRIKRHRRDRQAKWETIEEPVDLVGALRSLRDDAFVVVDCLTLWVANLLEAKWTEDAVEQAARQAASVLAARTTPTVVVSNEVGLGLVPETALGRAYRDVLGRVNAAFAEEADSAHLVVAGRVLDLGAPPA
jgi:adenosyl cobinamide kinase/adenosyl cobinamide phosphate guanylyltransferase